ncbi:MAG: hypothetical protein DYG89_47955 [Caldilinea sp. CFX5]|nr:hypothetical protein [Caldilinea sp. CFX5]
MAFEPVSPADGGGLLVQYGYCAANCLRQESWQIIAVGEASLNWAGVQLKLTATGKPRLLWFSQRDWHKDGQYLFASCDNACTRAANWRSVTVATASIGEGASDYFTLDAAGNPHFLYTSTQTGHTGAFYRYCLASCLSAQNWQEQQVSDNYLLGSFSLAFDAQNRLRLALSAEENRQSALVYVTCDAQCTTVANWQATALIGLGSELDLSLRLDAAGRPRLAVYTGNSGIQGEENRLYYFQCNKECHLFANWTQSNVGLAEGEGGNLSLLLDQQSRPHLAVTDGVSLPKQLSYIYCSSGCDTSRPVWQQRTIEDAETVATGLCSVGYAYIGYRPALAWRAANSLLITHGIQGRCLGNDAIIHLARLTAMN